MCMSPGSKSTVATTAKGSEREQQTYICTVQTARNIVHGQLNARIGEASHLNDNIGRYDEIRGIRKGVEMSNFLEGDRNFGGKHCCQSVVHGIDRKAIEKEESSTFDYMEV